MKIHINRPRIDERLKLWCPYCDEVVEFGFQHYYDEVWCLECLRRFPFEHQWPKGFDIKTGELHGRQITKA